MSLRPGFLRRALRRARGRLAMALGRAASSKPLDANFGIGRGTPIDRHYIERFLAGHACDIRGRVLEVGDAGYSQRFGGGRITAQDVLHVHENRGATIVGDLADPGTLPPAAFDCVILTQTLHLIFDMQAAVDNLHRALRPGGVLLITVPGITPVDRGEWKDSWYWSLTGNALERLLSGPFERDRLTVSTLGNLFAATSFLHGAAVQDVNVDKLGPVDAAYPVTVAARAIA